MQYIDMQSWPRRKHFNVYNAFDYPHFNVCANVDLTAFYPAVKQRSLSINVAIIYVLARAANRIPEFRYRIRDGAVVEHEVVHPSTTILMEDELFTFCTIEYADNFLEFAARAAEQILHVQNHPTLEDEPGQDDLLFMTSMPWISFTSVMHPLHFNPPDSVPRIAWGKFFEDGGTLKMPLSVQGHHALMDGIHMGRFYTEVQGCLSQPDFILA